jgi:hypothetical protein
MTLPTCGSSKAYCWLHPHSQGKYSQTIWTGEWLSTQPAGNLDSQRISKTIPKASIGKRKCHSSTWTCKMNQLRSRQLHDKQNPAKTDQQCPWCRMSGHMVSTSTCQPEARTGLWVIEPGFGCAQAVWACWGAHCPKECACCILCHHLQRRFKPCCL